MPIRLTTLAIARCIVLKEMADSNLYPDIREQKKPTFASLRKWVQISIRVSNQSRESMALLSNATGMRIKIIEQIQRTTISCLICSHK